MTRCGRGVCSATDYRLENGQRTRFGISEVYNRMPEEFWTDPSDVARETARAQYRSGYYDANHLDEIEDQFVQVYLFDCFVNPGIGLVRRIQQGLGMPLAQQDGRWGPTTRAVINNLDPAYVLGALEQARESYYQLKVDEDEAKKVYLEGWMRRAHDTGLDTMEEAEA